MSVRPLCLSVLPIWAWAIFHTDVDKDLENRNWNTEFRGTLYFQATKNCTRAAYYEACERIQSICPRVIIPSPQNLPRGVIVGRVRVANCVTKSHSVWRDERFSHALVLRDKERVPLVRVTGQQGFFRLPHEKCRELATLMRVPIADIYCNYRGAA